VRLLLISLLSIVPPLLFGSLLWHGRTHAPVEAKLTQPKAASADLDASLLALFKGEIGPAKVKEKATLYDEKGLFDYIDGAAPLFIDRHYRKLAAAELVVGGSDLVCDVYDMGAADNAKKIFETEKSSRATPVEGWPEAIAGSMSFVFHHLRFYVKLTAFDATAEQALPTVARALKGRMK
jgi:hypothetical protein